jgi:hypothetical protein
VSFLLPRLHLSRTQALRTLGQLPTSVPDDWEKEADLDEIFGQPTVQNEAPIATSSK